MYYNNLLYYYFTLCQVQVNLSELKNRRETQLQCKPLEPILNEATGQNKFTQWVFIEHKYQHISLMLKGTFFPTYGCILQSMLINFNNSISSSSEVHQKMVHFKSILDLMKQELINIMKVVVQMLPSLRGFSDH